MASPNKGNMSGLKRKLVECSSERASKAACVSREREPSAHGCYCRPMQQRGLADHCFNYLKSGLPRRIMFYKGGDWFNFPESITQILIEGFRDRRSSNEVLMAGQSHLVDFLSMVMINLSTRKQCSIAWIDEAEKCFFPTVFIDEVGDDSASSESGIMGSNLQRLEVERASRSQPEIVKHVLEESTALASRQQSAADVLRTKIEDLERESEEFLFAENLFLSGMGPFATANNILHIYRYAPSDMAAQARLQSFERQIKTTESIHGVANVKYGWFGSNKLDIVGILIHGFGKVGKTTEGVLGSGVCMSSENRSFASVNLCDVDEKGIQYMLLCRVILGNVEQVRPGSKLYCPSSTSYDSGVDNFVRPNHYLICSTQLNTRIHPEYVVSFKLAPRIHDYLSELKDLRFHLLQPGIVPDFSTLCPLKANPMKGPSSPWMPFTSLFVEIQDKICPLAKELLFLHYQELKANLITRENMVKKMTVIVGHSLLVAALQKLKRSPSSWFDSSPAEVKADILPVTNSKNDSGRLIIEKNECTSTNVPNTSLVKELGDSPATKLDANDSVASTKKTNGIAV
ncbi:inactive poly [ADP-ribose] polymerase RCD1-like isoform X2 [Dioscorea cayenensis subsp. rotundata]|uniref:Inactive poly [ADP-ribose] polymerase RCD1-like isoform X2 n=1 Tax=Dioscorea cayennensis subsp. rotundata TaxID=55577 RepID=A0AB40D0C8_DIOCR|nr:inactive poly [ADP-ribose] polymerase RCD1-like isoform X2 [Dioscorea cayenensis subsp. rotundata]